MTGDILRSYMRNLIQEQKAQEKLELRQQQAKQLEIEHQADTKASKEAVAVIEWESQPNTPTFDRKTLTKQGNDKKLVIVGVGSHTPNKKQNQLHIFIWRVYQVLSLQKKPTAQQLWNEIQRRHEIHDTNKIIQGVDGEQILWCSGYGNEQKLQRTTFDKTLSNIKKTPPL